MTALPVTADTCPVCGNDHASLDEYWACPVHGHRVTFFRRDGDLEVFRCPAHRCPHLRTAPPKPRSTSQGDPMTAIATRPSVAVDTMWARQKHIAGILPAHVEVKSFLGTAMAALYADPKLMKAAENAPESLVGALMECASLGHRPGTEEYYLTPRGGKILGIEGYRGIVERMYRSGGVAAVIVREVCAKDQFRFVEGEDQVPVHKIAGQGGGGTTGAAFFGDGGHADRGEMVGVYAYARLTTGGVSRVVLLSKADVLAARDSGDNDDPRYSPWHRLDGGKDHPEFTGRSMWLKTAVKRLEPWVPTSAEYRNAEARAAAQGAYVGTADPRDGSAPVSVTRRQAAELATAGIKASPSPEALKAAIRAHFDRLEVDDGQRDWNTRQLRGADDGEDLTAADLAKILSALESCEDASQLRDITGAAS
jgi:recombination protein RecT